jgi:hypothetical protein
MAVFTTRRYHAWYDSFHRPDLGRHTDWVFVLLAYLLWVGASRLKPGVRDLAKIWITPGIFIVWCYLGCSSGQANFQRC